MGKSRLVLKGRDRQWHTGGRTIVMGILNVTPDSFYDGGRFLRAGAAVQRGLAMAEEGADWIDVGGESSRPGAAPVAAEEEIKRVVPVVRELSSKGLTVAVDTTKASVAREAVRAGADIINDISALSLDPDMAQVCAESGAACVLMHMRGTPQTMQRDVTYGDLVGEVFEYLKSRLEYAATRGIDVERTVIDPGIGFGKSPEGNLELIRRLPEFRGLGRPILIGPSRKSFIGHTSGVPAQDRLAGTLAAITAAVLNGADIVRVHDVKEARRAVDIADALKVEERA